MPVPFLPSLMWGGKDGEGIEMKGPFPHKHTARRHWGLVYKGKGVLQGATNGRVIPSQHYSLGHARWGLPRKWYLNLLAIICPESDPVLRGGGIAELGERNWTSAAL